MVYGNIGSKMNLSLAAAHRIGYAIGDKKPKIFQKIGSADKTVRIFNSKVSFNSINSRPGKSCKSSSSGKTRAIQCPQNSEIHDNG